MLALISKSILFLFGLLLSVERSPGALAITAFLTAITLTSLNGYFQSRRIIRISSFAYFGISFFFPEFCPFLPLLCFDLFGLEPRALAALALVSLIRNRLELSGTAFLVALIFLALLLRYLCDETARLTDENIQVKDSGMELNRILTLQNKSLRDKQDYEIHLATLRERNRIAREIHDNVGHILSRSILQAGALQAMSKDVALTDHLTGLKDTLTLAMDSIRGSVHDLKDESVDLHDTLLQMLELDGYETRLNYDTSSFLPNEIKYCFLAIVKEALTNIAKHSDATVIRVTVQEHPAMYQLLIHDNGTKKPSTQNGGIGLSNMEERVKALSGHFTADYQNGFRIFISIPKQEEK